VRQAAEFVNHYLSPAIVRQAFESLSLRRLTVGRLRSLEKRQCVLEVFRLRRQFLFLL